MRKETEGTYQMLWDCGYCGSEGLLGVDHRHCPGCGGAQDPDARYFPSEEQKVAVEDHEYHGADKACGNCETPNSAKAAFCVNCGSPMDGSDTVQRQADAGDAAETPPPPPPPPPTSVGPAKRKAAMGVFGCGCVALIVVAIVFAVVAALWKKDVNVEVTGHSWERSIEIEKNKEVSESDWEEDVPRNASNVSCSKKKRGTEKVADGEECKTRKVDKGDGTYDKVKECKTKYKDKDIYAQYCSYKVIKWVTERTVKDSGTSVSDTPKWPKTSIRKKGDCTGCEREGKKRESYIVKFKGGGEKYTCDVAQKTWSGFKKGQSYKGKAGVITGALDCSALKKK